ncbi:dolichyl-phosphate beta-glucosyltransferase [Streptomyces sp. NPDC006879]|uniref:dolichyl-phosphate beta-glucosyltransferase n=1 Tax=Streptomyces sp. NPDC006879 TaxID=3364767 RepID=UPI0036C6ED3A
MTETRPAVSAWNAVVHGTRTVELSVVVPAFDEEQRIGPTLDALCAYLGRHPATAGGQWELIVVDDGSTDGTARAVRAAAAREPRIRLVSTEQNRGKGYALRLGVAASAGRRVLVTDADLATPVEELTRLEEALAGGGRDEEALAGAIGSRSHPQSRIERHQGRMREVLGRVGNRLIRAVAVPGIRDTQCGFKLFDGDRAREAFEAAELDGWGIDVEILQYFRARGWAVVEVPVRWAHQDGSKVRPADYLRVLGELLRLKRGGLAVCALFLMASTFLYKGLWADLDRRYLADAGMDQNQWEWFFRVTAQNVVDWRNPLFTDLQNFPDGVNLMANTVMLGLSVPLTPVTLALGPTVTWALVLTLGLTATGLAWYWLIRRWLVRSRWAAVLGAALCAYAPPMISHANAHPNFCVLFMIPVIIDRALRLCAPGQGRRVVRDGVLLGVFSAYQLYLGEEPFLLAAVGMLLFATAYALADRGHARAAVGPLLRGLAVAAAVALPLVAYPLYWQFFGPQSYRSVLHGDGAGNSPLAFVEYAGRSLFGNDRTADPLALNRTEQNAFYGWPLLALAGMITWWFWKRPAVKALAATAVGAALLSLGPRIRIPGTETVLPGPWRALAHQPLFESVIEGRVAMACAPPLGLLVALAADRLVRADRQSATPARLRTLGLAALAAALLPVVPTPFPVTDRPPVPAFVTQGLWKRYVQDGQTLVPIPVPDPGDAAALHWQTVSDLAFKLPGGYFNGPWGPDRIGIYGPSPRHTSNMLRDIRYGADPPEIGASWQRQAREDLDFWKAGVLVLAPQDRDAELRETVTKLLGRQPRWEGGAWIWPVGD